MNYKRIISAFLLLQFFHYSLSLQQKLTFFSLHIMWEYMYIIHCKSPTLKEIMNFCLRSKCKKI